MKKKDIIYALLAVVILLGAGYLVYSQVLKPKTTTSSSVTQVETVGKIDSSFDQGSLTTLGDPTTVIDFTPKVDLTNLGNVAPYTAQ